MTNNFLIWGVRMNYENNELKDVNSTEPQFDRDEFSASLILEQLFTIVAMFIAYIAIQVIAYYTRSDASVGVFFLFAITFLYALVAYLFVWYRIRKRVNGE